MTFNCGLLEEGLATEDTFKRRISGVNLGMGKQIQSLDKGLATSVAAMLILVNNLLLDV